MNLRGLALAVCLFMQAVHPAPIDPVPGELYKGVVRSLLINQDNRGRIFGKGFGGGFGGGGGIGGGAGGGFGFGGGAGGGFGK